MHIIYSKINVIDKINYCVGCITLSYQKYFKGSKPFTKINEKLKQFDLTEIDWTK
jgi:uracil DNA glycosylase